MSALDLDPLLALEHRGWESLCRSEGGTFYGNLMTEDAVMILVNGMVLDRTEVAASLNDAPPWNSFTLTEARVVPAGDGAAALVYKASSSRAGDEKPFVALMSSLYCSVDGRVRLALYQQTLMPG
jgi:hypothetical protein